MKILSLDIGDVWIGSALSDEIGITCQPYKTIKAEELESFLSTTLSYEHITTIVVGRPLTLSGVESDQTKKVLAVVDLMKKNFHSVTWILWDERLSSKRAQEIQGKKYRTKEGKKEEHSIAAAFILQSYLDSRAPELPN